MADVVPAFFIELIYPLPLDWKSFSFVSQMAPNSQMGKGR